jgi:hypothetical protein
MRAFTHWITSSRAAMRYVIIVGFGCMIYFILQKIHHRDGVSNFEIYYNALDAFLSGKPIYGVPFSGNSAYFTFAPLTLLFFLPFKIFPYSIAISFYYFLVLASYMLFTLYLIYYLEKEKGVKTTNIGWLILLVTLFLSDHFERQLHLGNVNVFLLIGSFFVYLFAERNRPLYGGLILGFLMLFQPYFVILIPYLLYRKKGMLVFSGAMTFAVALVIPAFFKGLEGNLALIHSWIDVLRAPSIHLSKAPNTLYGIYTTWILNPLGLEAGRGLILGGILVVVSILVLLIRKLKKTSEHNLNMFVEFFTIIAFIPHLVNTDTEQFMWTWPLLTVMFLLLQQTPKEKRSTYIGLLSIAFIPLVLNSPDIVGRKLMLLFDEGGVLGLANLILIAITLYLFIKRPLSGHTT